MKSKASPYRYLIALAASFALIAPAQAQVFNPGNGHWYQRIDATVTWTQARDAASLLTFEGLTGHLATVTSVEENDFIVANLGGFTALSGHWLGGFQDTTAPDYAEPAGGWRWITGETWSFTSWFGPGEPNNGFGQPENFLVYEHAAGRWNDLPDTLRLGYVVEFEGTAQSAAPEPGTLPLLIGGIFALGSVVASSTRRTAKR